jgi:hypothetical protein
VSHRAGLEDYLHSALYRSHQPEFLGPLIWGYFKDSFIELSPSAIKLSHFGDTTQYTVVSCLMGEFWKRVLSDFSFLRPLRSTLNKDKVAGGQNVMGPPF